MEKKDFGTAMYIIDENYRIVHKNRAMGELYPEIHIGEICHEVLAGLPAPCEKCPINGRSAMMYNHHRKEWVNAQAAEMEFPGHGQCYSIQFQLMHRFSSNYKELTGEEDITEQIVALGATNGSEALIGGYCEEGFPIFYVNDAMLDMLGFDDREEFVEAIDGYVINTVHPDDQDQVGKDMKDSFYPGKTFESMYRMPKKNGSWFWVVTKGRFFKTEAGELAIISMCTDMSSYARRQDALRVQNDALLKQELLSTAMMNNMPSGYHRCAATEGCPFIFISSNFENIVGWTKEEIEEQFDNLFENIIWPEDQNVMCTYNDMLKLKGKGNEYSTEIYRIKRKGGGYRWVLDSTMFVDLGEESFFQGTIADITEFIETQNKQKRDLEEAMYRVEEANDAKTQFLSAMSHDIRTPMNAIIGMTALATKHLDETEYVKNCLSKMTLASRHLLTLINDVLDISKVESGKMALNPIVFSLAETVTNLVNIVRQQISGKGHKFDVRVHNVEKEYLFADELRINQIFINILTNAVKYTPDGGTISLDIYEEEIPGAPDLVRVVYIVEDNGIGMSKEFQETMYNSFVRAEGQKYSTIQGSGLGLAISKKMIDLLDGTIECQSEPGKGSKFTITLDLPVADSLLDDIILPPMDVLLVDDDELFLESAADTLRSLGLSPYMFSSGKTAVESVIERHDVGNDYPVIIVDWQMPEMNGLETIREIRARAGKEVSIIVVSAYEWEDMEEIAREAGADGFISKPFFASNVYENMIEVLGLGHTKKDEAEDTVYSLNGMHILVAEDNDLNWEIAREILDMYGASSARAENGRVCVDMLNAADDGEYDLVLMDIRMPVLNGYEATKLIRASEREYIKNIAVVAMTADAFSDDIQRCMEVGMNAHVAKPINIKNLLNVLKNSGGGNAFYLKTLDHK